MIVFRRFFHLATFTAIMVSSPSIAGERGPVDADLVDLGKSLFSDTSLSGDKQTRCETCHDPRHHFSDGRARAVGVSGKVGTRNAPTLLRISQYSTFFWDGRRARLEDAVADPFTNPVEMGLKDTDELIARIKSGAQLMGKFHRAFRNEAVPTLEQTKRALAAYVRSLPEEPSAFDLFKMKAAPLSAEARLGLSLFTGAAGCSECHVVEHSAAAPGFTDQAFHHSGVAQRLDNDLAKYAAIAAQLPDNPALLGPRVLADENLAALGRFVISRRPGDVGSFRTPSLRNVAVTPPYMHDGSIATLAEAVDHEIDYRAFATGRSTSLSVAERRAIVAFLESLSDATNAPPKDQVH